MLTAKSNVAPSVDSQNDNKLMSVVNALAIIIIQEHIPNANLSSVLSNLNMQVSTCFNHYLFFYDHVSM